jgi:hypothetical protein
LSARLYASPRDDVHDGEPENSIRVIQCQTVGAARPAIVPRDAELVVAQMPHHPELVTADRAHAVRLVIGGTRRLSLSPYPRKSVATTV